MLSMTREKTQVSNTRLDFVDEYKKVCEENSKLRQLLYKVEGMNPEIGLMISAEMAVIDGVPEGQVLRTLEDVDAFFRQPAMA